MVAGHLGLKVMESAWETVRFTSGLRRQVGREEFSFSVLGFSRSEGGWLRCLPTEGCYQ